LAFHSGREADHSPPSGAEVKEWVVLYLHSPSTPSWRGAWLGEHRDDFTFLHSPCNGTKDMFVYLYPSSLPGKKKKKLAYKITSGQSFTKFGKHVIGRHPNRVIS
jgi:hypothetical protein